MRQSYFCGGILVRKSYKVSARTLLKYSVWCENVINFGAKTLFLLSKNLVRKRYHLVRKRELSQHYFWKDIRWLGLVLQLYFLLVWKRYLGIFHSHWTLTTKFATKSFGHTQTRHMSSIVYLDIVYLDIWRHPWSALLNI